MIDNNKIKIGETQTGSPIYRYTSEAPNINKNNTLNSSTKVSHVNTICSHVEQHIGDISHILPTHSTTPLNIHILAISPTVKKPYYRFITAGMSDYELPFVENEIDPNQYLNQYMELMITLPSYWKLDRDSLKNDKWAWPILLLQRFAHFPSAYNTALGYAHSIKHEDEPTYDKSTKLNSSLIFPSMTVPEDFLHLKINEEKTVDFYSLYPLYEEELNYKLDNGIEALHTLFQKHSITDVFNSNRRNTLKKKFWFF